MCESILTQKYVEELVLNSIHGNATCIAVRLDWMSRFLQVVDNGRGIGSTQLQLFCSRNNQNVENMVVDKHLEEALHLIIKHCSSLEIESQVKNSSVSYKRLYQNGIWRNVECVGTRSTSGTTVSVFDFFRPPSSEETFDFDYQSLEKLIASFFLLHSHISFSLRVDPSKPPSLQTKKAKNTMLAAQQLFKSDSIIPFRGSSRHFKVKGLFINHPGESSWFIFVNSQLVESKEIVDLITSVLSNLTSSQEQRFAIILNIKCSRAVCKFTIDSNVNRGVAFLNWNELLSLIQSSLDQFISHAPIKKTAFVSRWLIAAYGDGNLTTSPLTIKSLDFYPPQQEIKTETSEMSSPFRCEQSVSSDQSFYGKITNSIPIPLVSHAPENLEMRVRESPNVCRVSSPPLLLSPNHLASLWEEVEETAENTQLIQEPENGNLENGVSLPPDMGTSTSTCNLQEKDTQIEDHSSLDSSNRLALKRRYVSTDSDNRFSSKREFKIGRNYLTNAYWVQPKMPPNLAIKNLSSLFATALQKECTFTKSVMGNIHVVSQVDRKFICCITREDEKRYLVLIDQHAAHERVCLERLMQMHSTKNDDGYIQVLSSPLHPHLQLTFPIGDLQLIQKLSVEFTRFGLHLQFSDSTVSATRVPSCFLAREINEIQRKRSSLYKDLVVALIDETIAEFTKTGRLSSCLLPAQIRNVLNSLACHGAIKFGDELTPTQCSQLVKALGQCDVPFQCAHGRPLLAPLLEIGDLNGLTPSLITPDSTKPKYVRLMEYGELT
ncbi:putative MLH3, MutL protein 3 [Daphnia pulex]|uniref:Putative MLH3, MutL protein 3 n=1 Tax=Daphnia pulex TaxID=6669 RepID=E9H0X1_DAPPU|nr:putative MLH3, MutL protein 3 [Daphnia pulex]|eukprot:EFX74534.1 putative MLH3, MutL protein 3 [Daphnia pulex]